MENFYIIAVVQQEGLYREHVSVEYQDLYNAGMTVREFLTQYGNLQSEWVLSDVWTGDDSQGRVVMSWD